MYLNHSRPDIAYSVGVISRFMHNLTKNHLGAAKRIMRYVAGTVNFGIWYGKTTNFRLYGFTDSEWAGCMEDRKSISCFTFSLSSGVITWSSKKHPTTALSSFEAEYMVVASSACQVIWMRRILSDMKQEQDGVTLILCDNKSTISMMKNPVYHGRIKNIDIRAHFIRELVANGAISLELCGIEKQMANILTKSLPRNKHEELRRQLGVCEFGSRGDVGK